ncbi:MAG: hypothetical protein PHO32_09720, partial [Candidatus Cloacimonetes bacterium]|nr:hypothetical protein [Candidatus Cloacimonadota bacterium]
VVEGKSIEQIVTLLNIPPKTLYNWARKYKWDDDIKNGGGLSLYLEMQKQFVQKVKESIANNNLTDPSTTDSLWKLAKLIEKQMPQRVMLSNIFQFVEDMVNYFINAQLSNEFMELLHEHTPKFADFLRKRYTNE